MTNAITSADMCKNHPGLAAASARLRVARFLKSLRGDHSEPAGFSAARIAQIDAYNALLAAEVAETRLQSRRDQRKVSLHKKALRAGRHQEAARYGFVIERGAIRLTGEG